MANDSDIIVTQDQVTLRHEHPGLAQGAPATGKFAADALLVDRYRVQAGPLGQPLSGEAQVYRCHDELDDEAVAVKVYFGGLAPKPEIMQALEGLNHPYLVALKCVHQWQGRLVEVQEYCAGGDVATGAPHGQAALEDWLPAILEALAYLHQEGIIHRDVKPTNLLFRDKNRQQLLLSDFGISSHLNETDQDQGVRRTGSFNRYTLDYTAPEFFSAEEVSAATDYYALGITLNHLLRGESPFEGWNPQRIMMAHAQNNILLPEKLDERFAQLLTGLTQPDTNNRWGYIQVRAWLDHAEVLDHDGHPWQAGSAASQAMSYPGFPAAGSPRELAANLGQFNAENELFRGDIRNWVFQNYFGAEMAERIEAITENYTDRRALGVFKLEYVLDPDRPLRIGEHRVRSLRELAGLLASEDEAVSGLLESRLFEGYIEAWIEAAEPLKPVERNHELAQRVRGIRTRLDDRRLGLFALLHTLDPQRGYAWGVGQTVDSPAALGQVIESTPAEWRVDLTQALLRPEFREWLRACEFDDWQDDVAHIEACVSRAEAGEHALGGNDEPELANRLLAYDLLSRFYPELALPVLAGWVTDTQALARHLDADARSRQLGMHLLNSGWIGRFLATRGRHDARSALGELQAAQALDEAAKLEEALAILDPELPAPAAQSDTGTVDFGWVTERAPKTLTVNITSRTRGHLYGAVSLEHADRGFTTSSHLSAQDGTAQIEITADSRGLRFGRLMRSTLIIRSNGGELRIPLRYRAGWRGGAARSSDTAPADAPPRTPRPAHAQAGRYRQAAANSVSWILGASVFAFLALNWMETIQILETAMSTIGNASPSVSYFFDAVLSNALYPDMSPSDNLLSGLIALPLIVLHILFKLVAGLVVFALLYTAPIWIAALTKLGCDWILVRLGLSAR